MTSEHVAAPALLERVREDPDLAPEEYQRGRIVGVRARVPVGMLSVRSSPRATSQHAEIVSSRVYNHVEVSP